MAACLFGPEVERKRRQPGVYRACAGQGVGKRPGGVPMARNGTFAAPFESVFFQHRSKQRFQCPAQAVHGYFSAFEVFHAADVGLGIKPVGGFIETDENHAQGSATKDRREGGSPTVLASTSPAINARMPMGALIRITSTSRPSSWK